MCGGAQVWSFTTRPIVFKGPQPLAGVACGPKPRIFPEPTGFCDVDRNKGGAQICRVVVAWECGLPNLGDGGGVLWSAGILGWFPVHCPNPERFIGPVTNPNRSPVARASAGGFSDGSCAEGRLFTRSGVGAHCDRVL